LTEDHGADRDTAVKFGSSAGNLKFHAVAIDMNVILSGAKDLKYLFSMRKFDGQRCLKAWPHASHFVAALALNMT
jgi:hypothetical protein